MDLLRIEHEDFILTVESTRFEPVWQKGVANLGKEKLPSTCCWNEDMESVD